jgi:micrococcal nuclease
MDKKQVLTIGIGALFVLLALGVSGAAALHRLGLQTESVPTQSLPISTRAFPLASSLPAIPSRTLAPRPTLAPPTATPTPSNTDIWLPFIADIATSTLPVSSTGFDCLHGEPLPAEVVSVVDGDTIHMSMGDQEASLRYIGVDSPEDPDPSAWLGAEATAKNRLLVDGKRVLLFKDSSETDAFDRLLRYVVLEDGTFVNLEMVSAGLAQARPYPPDTACQALFAEAEDRARQSALGLWSATPVPVAAAPETAAPASAPPAATPVSVPQSTCNCRGPDLDCSDFSSQAQAQACFAACKSQGLGDIFRLDGDHDGRVCERLP